MPDNYQLSLQPDINTMRFSGQVVITGQKVGRPSQRLTFHQNGLRITGATVVRTHKGKTEEVPIDRINCHNKLFELRLHSPDMLYPGHYSITLDFDGHITRDMNGLYPCFFKHGGKQHTLLMTQFESHYARDMFPCIDEPAAKATFDLSISAPKDLTVLSNTPEKSCSDHQDLTTHVFETTPRMSTYLLALIIGEVHGVETTTESGVHVGAWGTIAQPKEALNFGLDVAKRSIEFFENYFDTPYPLSKVDHVAVPDFSSGAMENWGLITYREVAFLVYPEHESQSVKENVASVIGHETSHQWFGNLVTMAWWDDLWLNESFANMMEYRVVDALFPEWNIWDAAYTLEGLAALRRDALPKVQAIKTDVNHPDEINTLFDPSIVYAKGGRLLHMLMHYIGEDAFRQGLKAYFKKHAYRNTTGADLWEALSQASGRDIAAFMNPWLERSGYPVLHVNQQGTSIEIRQQHFQDAPVQPDDNLLWPVPLFASTALPVDTLTTSAVQMTAPDESYVLLGNQGAGHYIVHYENPDHRAAIIQRVRNAELSTVDRLALLNTSAMLAKGAISNFGDTLRLLTAYDQESNDAVWDIMAVIVADARRFTEWDEHVDSQLKALCAQLIGPQLQRLGWKEKPSDSSDEKKLRATVIALGAYAEVPAVIDEGLRQFAAYRDTNAKLVTELRALIFGIAVRHGDSGDVDFLLKQHDDTQDSELRGDIAAALTSTKAPDTAKRLLDRLQNNDIIKPQDADRWLFSMLRNHHIRTEAWDWMEQNWDWILRIYGRDKSLDYFPRIAAMTCNTPQWQTRYDNFFGAKLDNPLIKRNILIGQAEISARVAWLERDLPEVRAFLDGNSPKTA